MFPADKTEFADLPTVYEVPNIIPHDRRETFFAVMNQSRTELSELFHPTKPPYLADLGIDRLFVQINRWVLDTIPDLHRWFAKFLEEYDSPMDADAIENTVRQIEGIGAFLAREAWDQLRVKAARPLDANEEDVAVYGRRILSETNNLLILIVQTVRDWGEKKRLEAAQDAKTPRKRRAASKGKKRAGRPQTTDPVKDTKLYNDWKSSGMSQKDFARERNIDHREIAKAKNRMRKREVKPAE